MSARELAILANSTWPILTAALGFAASLVSSMAVDAASGVVAASDPLLAGFQAPPESARPRVWWHWMNGNITWDGARNDMDWMKRVGIAGLQSFDAGRATPQV